MWRNFRTHVKWIIKKQLKYYNVPGSNPKNFDLSWLVANFSNLLLYFCHFNDKIKKNCFLQSFSTDLKFLFTLKLQFGVKSLTRKFKKYNGFYLYFTRNFSALHDLNSFSNGFEPYLKCWNQLATVWNLLGLISNDRSSNVH